MSDSLSITLPQLVPLVDDPYLNQSTKFDASEFLLHRQLLTLQELDMELHEYAVELHQKLEHVVESDYMILLSLGSHLGGTVKRVEELQLPVKTLNETCQGQWDALESKIKDMEDLLNSNDAAKRELKDLVQLQEAAEALDLCEQISAVNGDEQGNLSRLNTIHFQLNHLCQQPYISASPWFVQNQSRIGSQAKIHGDRLQAQLKRVVAESDSQGLMDLGSYYRLLGKEQDMYEGYMDYYRESVRSCLLDASALESHETFQGLPYSAFTSILSSLIQLLETRKVECQAALAVHVDLYAHALIPLVLNNLVSDLPDAFSVSKTNEFQRNFIASEKFITYLQSLTTTDISTLESTKSFKARWQTSVYASLRMRELITKLQTQVLSDILIIETCLSCWSENVFLPQCVSEFWTFTMQTLLFFSAHIGLRPIDDWQRNLNYIVGVQQAIPNVWSRITPHLAQHSQASQRHLELCLPTLDTVRTISDHVAADLVVQCCQPLEVAMQISSRLVVKSQESWVKDLISPLKVALTEQLWGQGQERVYIVQRVVQGVILKYSEALENMKVTTASLLRYKQKKAGANVKVEDSNAIQWQADIKEFKIQLQDIVDVATPDIQEALSKLDSIVSAS